MFFCARCNTGALTWQDHLHELPKVTFRLSGRPSDRMECKFRPPRPRHAFHGNVNTCSATAKVSGWRSFWRRENAGYRWEGLPMHPFFPLVTCMLKLAESTIILIVPLPGRGCSVSVMPGIICWRDNVLNKSDVPIVMFQVCCPVSNNISSVFRYVRFHMYRDKYILRSIYIPFSFWKKNR